MAGEVQLGGCGKCRVFHLACRVYALSVSLQFSFIDIKPNRVQFAAESKGERQAYIAQAYDGNSFIKHGTHLIFV